MRFLFLTPSLEPSHDGVGDYTWRLATQLANSGHQSACIALHDRHSGGFMEPHEGEERIPFWRFPAGTPPRILEARLREIVSVLSPDLVSLQYVPHGFSKHGMPTRLPGLLSSISGDFTWHLMFHELWIGSLSGENFKRKSIGMVQRMIVRSLCRRLRPPRIHTSNLFYQRKLWKAGIDSEILPLFSNIPVSTPDPAARSKLLSDAGISHDSAKVRIVVLFGAIHPEWDPSPLLQEISSVSRPCLILSIGKVPLRGLPIWNRMIEWASEKLFFSMLGELPALTISEILHAADFGATTEASELLGKSGTVTAMLEHGLPVIVSRSLGTGETLRDSRFVVIGNKEGESLSGISKRPVSESLPAITSLFIKSINPSPNRERASDES